MSSEATETDTRSLGAEEWHALLARLDDASLEQTSAYAAAQLSVRRVPRARLGVAVVKFGPMATGQRQGVLDEAAPSACVGALRSQWVEAEGLSVRVMPAAGAAPAVPGALQAALEHAGSVQTPIAYPDRYLVNLVRGALVRGGLGLRELTGVWRARLDKVAPSGDR